jgi:hypothetical protein
VKHKLSVDFWDVDMLASKMLGVLRYGCMREEMRKNGHREIRGMSWNDAAKETMSVYSKTIN